MNWTSKISLLVLLIGLSQCNHPTSDEQKVEKSQVKRSKYLIEASELAELINHDSIKVIDMRPPSEYAEGHLPNAIHIWRQDIQDNDLMYAGMRASKEQMEQLFSDKVIKSSDFLVIYDDKSSCEAARMWWVLDYYGFDQMAILHGGIKAWTKNNSLTKEVKPTLVSNFAFKKDQMPDRTIGVEELMEMQATNQMIILDTRSVEEYQGVYQKKGAFDRGRITGSVNMDWLYAMNEEDQTFKSNEELRALYEKIGISSDNMVVTYCHSGVRSSHTLFVMTQLLG